MAFYIYHCIKLNFFLQFIYEEEYIDLAENKEWFERYKYDIPVIHMNGDLLMMHRVDQDKLRTALDSLTNNKT